MDSMYIPSELEFEPMGFLLNQPVVERTCRTQIPVLVGGWTTNPSEKWWSSSVGMMTFPTEWKVIKFMFQTTNQSLNQLNWEPHTVTINHQVYPATPRGEKKRYLLAEPPYFITINGWVFWSPYHINGFMPIISPFWLLANRTNDPCCCCWWYQLEYIN